MTQNRYLHLYAVFTALATFCLIIAGGLVTSTGSGLSVPTWPFAPHHLLPPLVGGVLFEYGHRMVAGAVIGLTAILVIWIFRSDAGKPLRWLGIISLVAILAQAALGGITVLFGLPPAVSIAHAGLAQAFFCVMVCIAFLTMPNLEEQAKHREPGDAPLYFLTLCTPIAIYAQILAGAVVRHIGAGLSIPDFPAAFGHLFPPAVNRSFPVLVNFTHTRVGALIVATLIVWTSIKALQTRSPFIRKTGILNLFLLIVQILLGASIVWSWKAIPLTTAHVACGALLLAINVVLAIETRLLLQKERRVAYAARLLLFFLCFSLCGGAAKQICTATGMQETASGARAYQEKCLRCHEAGLNNAQTENNRAADWQYVHLWNPKLLDASATMPSQAKGFKLVRARISKQTFLSPSGDTLYGLEPSSPLKKLFTFNQNHLAYLFLSAVTWENPPVPAPGLSYGLKAFTAQASWPNGKGDGYPVVWIPREIAGAVHPGDAITLIVPTTPLKQAVTFAQSLYRQAEPDWCSVTVESEPNQMENGKPVFEKYCAACHGKLGDGLGPASVFLFPKPRDFTSGEFKFKTTPSEELPADADLFRTITSGLHGTAMPSFQFLPAETRWELVQYVKSLAVDPSSGKSFFVENPPRDRVAMTPPNLSGTALDAAIANGKNLFYNLAKCNDCHGPGAKSVDRLPHGDGPSSLSQMDDWGYPIKPADLAGGILKRGNSPEAIYLDITTGIPGTPMPTYRDTLSEKERWEIAFYVSRLNRERGHGKDLAPASASNPY